jgi:hypothetical protein
MNSAGHVARIGDKRNYVKVKSGNQKARDCLTDLSVCGLIKLKLILKIIDHVKIWSGFIWLRIMAQRQALGHTLQHRDEHTVHWSDPSRQDRTDVYGPTAHDMTLSIRAEKMQQHLLLYTVGFSSTLDSNANDIVTC